MNIRLTPKVNEFQLFLVSLQKFCLRFEIPQVADEVTCLTLAYAEAVSWDTSASMTSFPRFHTVGVT